MKGVWGVEGRGGREGVQPMFLEGVGAGGGRADGGLELRDGVDGGG